MGRKHGDLRLQVASLEEEVAQVRSRAREEKILPEARIEEDCRRGQDSEARGNSEREN